MASDFLAKPLAVGDHVVFIRSGMRSFSIGRISRVLPQKVEVEYQTQGLGRLVTETAFRFPEDVVRV